MGFLYFVVYVLIGLFVAGSVDNEAVHTEPNVAIVIFWPLVILFFVMLLTGFTLFTMGQLFGRWLSGIKLFSWNS